MQRNRGHESLAKNALGFYVSPKAPSLVLFWSTSAACAQDRNARNRDQERSLAAIRCVHRALHLHEQSKLLLTEMLGQFKESASQT